MDLDMEQSLVAAQRGAESQTATCQSEAMSTAKEARVTRLSRLGLNGGRAKANDEGTREAKGGGLQ